MKTAIALLSLTTAVCAAAPAGAVVHGTPVSETSVPWFVSLPGCGGSLVTPDRVVTAGHCVAGHSPSEFPTLTIGDEYRHVARVALHPGWTRANGDNLLEDVAVLQLDQPVTSVAPVAIGTPSGADALIMGRGRTLPPGSGNEAQSLDTTLREAPLRPLGDKQCAGAYKTARGNGGERYDSTRMLCAIDSDGKAPLYSGCNGDSGGPFYGGTHESPVLYGIVSWGGYRCGADHLPSVFADASRDRAFITGGTPTWQPAANGPAKISGSSKAKCTAPSFSPRPDKIAYEWMRNGRTLSHSRTYTPKHGERKALTCIVTASGKGGYARAIATAR